MTAPIDQVGEIRTRLSAVVDRVLREEVEKLRVPAPRVIMARPDAEILAASRKVASASAALEQAKFAGIREVAARQALERAAKALGRALRKHGRYG